jgi:hypothetical protein
MGVREGARRGKRDGPVTTTKGTQFLWGLIP